MSAEHPASSLLSCNLESPIYTDFLRHDEKEKLLDQSEDRSSGDENEELDPEPPPVAVRRKVSFADAFGLNLVSVKEFDNRDSSGSDNFMGLLGPEGEEFYLTCLFTIPASDRDLMVRLQQQKMDLESIELLPGTTTVRGIIRVLNLCFHKAVYVRTSLDGWQSYFDLLAEYVPGSSDGETDRFSFQLMLTPPFQAEGARVEFCLRYESSVGTFWANNGNMNYTVFCHQRRRSDLKEKEREREKEGLADESNQKGIRSCLKTISKKICPDTPTEASGDNSEYVRLRAGRTREKATAEERDITSPKSLRDCCKTLVDRRRKRRAARLARVQDYISQKDMEIYKDLQVQKLSIPVGSELTTIRAGKMQSMETPPILMYHQIPLLSLDWGNNTTAPVHAKPTDVFSGTDPESHQAEDRSAKSTNDVRKTFISADSTHTHDSTQDQECHLAEPVFNDSAQSQSNLEVIGPGDSGVVELMERTLSDVHEGAEKDQDYVDWKALDILESDPREQSNDLSTGHSREPVPDYQHAEEPENTLMTCAVQESEPKGEGKESEGPCDRRTPQYENTSRPLSEDLARSLESPGDMGQATRDGESQNSKAGDRISPEECTSSFDTSNAEAKVKENINQAVNETLTFKGIREEPFRDRQTAGSTERRDTDKDGELDTANKNVGEKKGSEEQVKIRARREEPKEEVRKDEKTLSTRDQSPEIQSVSLCESAAFNESKLCTPNKNLNRDNSDLQRDEERCFESVKEGLKMKKRLSERTAGAAIDDAGDDYEVYSETSRENEEESRVGDDYTDGEEIGGGDAFIESLERKETSHQLHATAHACINAPTHRRDPSSLQDRDATSADEDFELGKTLRNRAAQDSQELDGEDERPTPLPSVHLSWAGGPGCGRLLSWWGQFCALGHVTQALVCAVLFAIFVTVYLYDLPTCLGLYLFSVLWWCGQGVKQRLDGAVSVD